MSFRRLAIILCCILFAAVASAQRRQLQEARIYLKSGKNFDKAEKLMTDLLKDSANRDNKRIYDYWWQSVQKQYEQANEKFYMKQQQDTAKFFALVRQLFSIAFTLDSVDARPDKKGRVDIELRKSVARDMYGYRANLFFGGAYHVRKNDFEKGYDYFETYINCAKQPLFTDYDLTVESDTRMAEAGFWAAYCGFRLQQPVLTLRYRNLALRDSSKRERTMQYVAESWQRLNDDSMYVATLAEGFREYPTSNYFFPRLMDSYTRKRQLDKALQTVDYALEADSLNELFLYAKSNVLLQQEKYAESLKYAEKLISVNDMMAEAYFNAGTAYLNIALNMDPQRHKKQIRKMYQKAMPYMEKYRAMAPGEQIKWAPALYRIYFNLNLGKQFDEIDKLLR